MKSVKSVRINSSAPGRICLFGEHQDYLGFPVIAAAIDLRMTISGEVWRDKGDSLELDLPDIGRSLSFDSQNIRYSGSKDYIKSSVNVLKTRGLYVPQTIRAVFSGNVPIQAGTSSSAALTVAWNAFLLQAAKTAGKETDSYLSNPAAVAELAYCAEVEEFKESGGRMDQYSSAIGGIVYLDFHLNNSGISAYPLPLSPNVREFVLGDSRQPKDTQKTLKRVRTAQEEGFKQLRPMLEFEDPFGLTLEQAQPFFEKIDPEILPYLRAALTNHAITDQAREELSKEQPDTARIAQLMNQHHQQLRDGLKISTAKIDVMIDAAMAAGALAGKINGSGEGGCMFAFCPGKQQEVAQAIEKAGGVPYIINIGPGVRVEHWTQ